MLMKKTTTPMLSASTSASEINEIFLHYVWKTKNFQHSHLTCTKGREIKMLQWGQHNHNAGPDFLDGKILYDGIVWAGHIELHVRSSDWYRHHHQVDPAYDQVVLHVVWEDDRPVTDIHLNPIPTLVLRDLVKPGLFEKTTALVQAKHRLPCATQIGELSTFWLNAWKERQLVERLEARTIKIQNRLEEVQGDWEQVAFEFLFRSMGFHANSDPLEELAQNIKWKLVRKIIFSPIKIQALLFGRSGLLDKDVKDEYPMKLALEYAFLKKKYTIPSKVFIKWNFKGARPSNFPTIRLAQLASILENKASLIRKLIEAQSIEELANLFSVNISTYWDTHYVFNKKVDKARHGLSSSSINLLLINYCIPLIYAYGFVHENERLKERAIRFLYSLKSEKNAILTEFAKAGVHMKSAAESQALLHTYKNYCASKHCLSCQVGAKIVG